MLLKVSSQPELSQFSQPRWTLESLRRACPLARVTTVGGMSQLLQRLGIHYKRARDHIHSPDPDYQAKLTSIQLCLQFTRGTGGREVTLFEDELTFYRQPTLARAYASCGRLQALAQRSPAANTATRIAAVLDPLEGRVVFLQRSHFSIRYLIQFYQLVCASFPEAALIHLVQDNWPIHLHPDLRAALRPQVFPFDLPLPSNWPHQPSSRALRLNLPIQLELLPTYASWANPIEKLWRKLKQELLHLHPWATHWDELRARVTHFLSQYARGSPELLRYVGLLGSSNLFSASLGLAR